MSSEDDVLKRVKTYKKKMAIKQIESKEHNIREHEEKIRQAPNDQTVSHWKNEINNWEHDVDQLRRGLNEGGYEAYCPKCGKTVYVRNKKCPKCSTYLG